MTWAAPHVFAYGETPTSANFNNNFANQNEMAAAKFTAKGQVLAATGANAGAVVPVTGAGLGWGLIYDATKTMGTKFAPVPVVLDYAAAAIATLVNSSAETSLWSYALAAGALTARAALRFEYKVYIVNNTGLSRDMTAKFYIGASSVTNTWTVPTGTTPLVLTDIFVRAMNSTSNQEIFIRDAASSTAVSWTTLAEDMTAAKTIQLTLQLSAASASLSVYLSSPLLTLIPAMT